MSNPMNAFYKKLRIYQFSRTNRSRNADDCHIYEVKFGVTQDVTIDVQLWPDGKHRASHSVDGCSCVPPTYFTSPDEMITAIQDQINKIPVTRARFKKPERAS